MVEEIDEVGVGGVGEEMRGGRGDLLLRWARVFRASPALLAAQPSPFSIHSSSYLSTSLPTALEVFVTSPFHTHTHTQNAREGEYGS